MTGKVYNSTTNGQIGGVVARTTLMVLVDNVISNVSGTNVYSISGDRGYKTTALRKPIKLPKVKP